MIGVPAPPCMWSVSVLLSSPGLLATADSLSRLGSPQRASDLLSLSSRTFQKSRDCRTRHVLSPWVYGSSLPGLFGLLPWVHSNTQNLCLLPPNQVPSTWDLSLTLGHITVGVIGVCLTLLNFPHIPHVPVPMAGSETFQKIPQTRGT